MLQNDLLKKLYFKILCLYSFYILNLINAIIFINIFSKLSCIIFNSIIYVDLFFKVSTLFHIIYVYIKNKYNTSFIFLWKWTTSIFFISYPLFFFIINSQNGWNNYCMVFNPIHIYLCIFNSVFFFIIFKIGNRRIIINDTDECVICLENIYFLDKAIIDNCGHVFHRICLETWLEYNNSCPTCRNRCTLRNIS
jgi:hypothetical protein